MNSDLAPSTKTGINAYLDGSVLAFLLIRLWLGLRALVTGIEKFSGIKVTEEEMKNEFGEVDIPGLMVEVKQKAYGFEFYHGVPEALYPKFVEEPLVPNWALGLFDATLGYILIGLGILLLLGAFPRIALAASGLVYTALGVGLILLKQDAGIAWLASHVLLVVGGLLLVERNRLAVLNKY